MFHDLFSFHERLQVTVLFLAILDGFMLNRIDHVVILPTHALLRSMESCLRV